MDDPSFTQPTMYSVIDNRPTVPDLFSEKLKVMMCLKFVNSTWFVEFTNFKHCSCSVDAGLVRTFGSSGWYSG